MKTHGEMDYQQLIYGITSQAKTEFEQQQLYDHLPHNLQQETVANAICRIAMERTYQCTVKQLLAIHYHLLQHDAMHYRYQPGDDKIQCVWRHAACAAELELAALYA